MVSSGAAGVLVMKNHLRIQVFRCLVVFMGVLIATGSSLFAADNPRNIDPGPGITAVKTLRQNWTDEESNWFYNVPQGSLLVPYDWFLKLEQPTTQEAFRAPEHMRALGYITRFADSKNPDGLPIGFTQDGPDGDGVKMLGLTCSACHTGQIKRNGDVYLVDGGPSMANLERFLKELAFALDNTMKDAAKFDRFARAVLPTATDEAKTALLKKVTDVAGRRVGYNERNLPRSAANHFGPGRIDAFGAIFNEVASTFLEIPGNVSPANAPVSFPCLWDTPQHERVQWNGAAENKTNPLGDFLVGTRDIGALGRNAGEVIGVFGDVEINKRRLSVRYDSSVKHDNLIAVENSMKGLWSPLWPEGAFGAIDAEAKAQGGTIFATQCLKCHDPIDRTSPSRRVKFKSSDEGTDPNMNRNFGRTAATGRLEGRRKTLFTLKLFGDVDSVGSILKHVVERSILKPVADPIKFASELREFEIGRRPSEIIDALNPGYRMTVSFELGGKKLFGRVESLIKQGQSMIVRPINISSDADVPEEVEIPNAGVKSEYKSRPLNGVWATAPYLHNGSVPSLAELLKPAAQRVKSFHVGGVEFDAENVGFKDDPVQPVYNVTLDGNSNAGHEYGTQLSKDERHDLLEYLKSL